MKVLQICHKVPYPPNEGGSIAMNLITEGLLEMGHQVKVLAINTKKNFVDIQSLPKDYLKNTRIEAVCTDTSIRVWEAFKNLFSSKSYNVVRFISSDFNEKLITILKNEAYDVVQLESLYVCPYIETIRKYSNAKIIYRAHNIEYLIWERTYKAGKNLIKRAYIRLLAKRLKIFEIKTINKIDGIAAITPFDVKILQEIGCVKPIISIPVGFYLNKIKNFVEDIEFPSFFHIGSMNWIPNIDGLKWFINQVWLPFFKQNNNVKFYIAGRNMPECFKNLESINVINIGEVENAYQFMQSKAVMIVPLLSGSGMRVKIIEAMANGKTIIATTIAAEGINYKKGENIIIADTPQQFLDAINYCKIERKTIDNIGKNAKLLIENEYDNFKIVSNLDTFYKKIC